MNLQSIPCLWKSGLYVDLAWEGVRAKLIWTFLLLLSSDIVENNYLPMRNKITNCEQRKLLCTFRAP